MKFSENKVLQLQFFLFFIVALCVGSLVTERITAPDLYSLIKVEEKGTNRTYSEPDSLRPLIRNFNSTIRVVSHPYLNVIGNKTLAFFLPGFFDPIYILFVITLCVIFFVRIRNLDSEKPFTPQLVQSFRYAGTTCLIFALLDFFRLKYIDRYVQHVTLDTYRLERFSFFSSGLAWAGIIILWTHRILQKAEKIQTEQDLTV